MQSVLETRCSGVNADRLGILVEDEAVVDGDVFCAEGDGLLCGDTGEGCDLFGGDAVAIDGEVVSGIESELSAFD